MNIGLCDPQNAGEAKRNRIHHLLAKKTQIETAPKYRETRSQIIDQYKRLDHSLDHRRIDKRLDGCEGDDRTAHQHGFAKLGENDKCGRNSSFLIGDGDCLKKRRKDPYPDDYADLWREICQLFALKKIANGLRKKIQKQTRAPADDEVKEQNIEYRGPSAAV